MMKCRVRPLGAFSLWMLLVGCEAEPTGSVALLLAGDSDVAYWETSEHEDAVNTGVGGATCQDVLDTIDEDLDRYQPTRVVLVCGENDLWGQEVSATFGDFERVVERIHQFGAGVYYMGTKPEPDTRALHEQYRAYDESIRQYALSLDSGETAPLVMIDVYRGFEDLGNPRSFYRDDGLHLSDEGYAQWDRWLSLALADASCILWQSDACVEARTP